MNRVYANQKENVSISDINLAIQELLDEQEVAFENYYASMTANQAALLVAIAKERKVVAPMSQGFIQKYRLPALSSIKTALRFLTDNLFVYKYNGAYIVYDRFLGMWLRERI